MPKSKPIIAVPHSWGIETWPADIFPRTSTRARYVLRAHRDELIAAGALARIGRELVVFGSNYVKWLHSHVAEVQGYVIAPNRNAREEVGSGR